MYLGAKRCYINTLPFLSFSFPRYAMVIWTSTFSTKTRPVHRLCLRWVAWDLEPSLTWCPAWKTLFQWNRISPPPEYRSTSWMVLASSKCCDQGLQRHSKVMPLIFMPYVISQLQHADRLDTGLVWYLYMADSLKADTRNKRGKGVRRRVEPSSAVPPNWQEFLHIDNKTELFSFLASNVADIDTNKNLITTQRHWRSLLQSPSHVSSSAMHTWGGWHSYPPAPTGCRTTGQQTVSSQRTVHYCLDTISILLTCN